jgi:arsenic resistance protein ArsH
MPGGKGHVPKNLKTPLDNLPTVAPEHFRVPDPARLAPSVRAIHAPRILLLYGSLRERSFSRLLAEEAARLLRPWAARCASSTPPACRCPTTPRVAPQGAELRALAQWSRGHGVVLARAPRRHDGHHEGPDRLDPAVAAPCAHPGQDAGRDAGVGGSQSFNAVNQMRVLGRWLREKDLNLRPLGYEPNELPDCSIAR